MRDEAVTVRDLAAVLKVHPNTVYGKASDERPVPAGCIPGFRVGRAWRFDLSEVKAVLMAGSDPWALPKGRDRAA